MLDGSIVLLPIHDSPDDQLLLIAGALQNLRASTRAQTKREGWWQMDLRYENLIEPQPLPSRHGQSRLARTLLH
jgi:hypothetical protein